jgi:hypothetical protein
MKCMRGKPPVVEASGWWEAAMKKALFALMLLLVLLLPMYAGIARIRRLSRRRDEDEGDGPPV